jgi:hypothetical protein
MALEYLAAQSRWGRERDRRTVVLEAMDELERAARCGELQLIGRPRHSLHYEKIKPHYWRTAGLEIISHVRRGATPRTELREWSPPDAVMYEDLLTARTKVEFIWPR